MLRDPEYRVRDSSHYPLAYLTFSAGPQLETKGRDFFFSPTFFLSFFLGGARAASLRTDKRSHPGALLPTLRNNGEIARDRKYENAS